MSVSMTNAMDDVLYEKRNFLYDPRVSRHPMHLSERHYYYPLCRDDTGCLDYLRADDNHRLKCPRRLGDMCIMTIVHKIDILNGVDLSLLPSNIHTIILTEAIFQREAHAVEWLVSTWPMKTLRVYDVIPLEDYLDDNYMTARFSSDSSMCLADCVIAGVLKLKPESALRYLDVRKFEKDRTLCKELCRLPILWTKPEDRTVETIHDSMSETLEVTKDKVQRFLNRIDVVYHHIDSGFIHGNKIGPITILLDLKITLDDVPLGLSLQRNTPFKFTSNRVWMKHISEVMLAPTSLPKILDINKITHFEYEDPALSNFDDKFRSLLDALASFKHLFSLSLPSCIDVNINQTMATSLNEVLVQLKSLQRLSFTYCNLRGQLSQLLCGLRQKLQYLNVQDCRLNEDDIFFLVTWRPLASLRELNLSCNNLQHLDQVLIAMLERMPHITCFSASCCQLSIHSQVLIARECKEASRLKVMCMQSYVPLPLDDVLELLHICSDMPRVQKVLFFPELYAFPGNNDILREQNKMHMLLSCYRYLDLRSRDDIELE